jgi:hypothetical protein
MEFLTFDPRGSEFSLSAHFSVNLSGKSLYS